MHPTAIIHEIFSSRQGEGSLTGTWMTFLRFQGCPFSCAWCDTLDAIPFNRDVVARIETPPRSSQFRNVQNPCTPEQLSEILAPFSDTHLAITGGEPLMQADFLAAWLPSVTQTTLLETAGIQHRELRKIAKLIDIISMDLKLPSSTGMRDFWREHEEFLKVAAACGAHTYVKIVATASTTAHDIETGFRLIERVAPDTLVYMQHASPTSSHNDAPAQTQVDRWLELAAAHRRLRIHEGRQMHKVWGVL